MNLRRNTLGVSMILLVAWLFSLTEASAASCESLRSLALENSTITLAESVGAGEFVWPGNGGNERQRALMKQLPPFCRVAATLKPSSDSDIKIEVWMPTSGWNGKFMGVGNGGFNGAIQYNAMARALQRGYATSSTDTGHSSGADDASWALGHPEKQIDFGYRAVHEMTVKAKSIIGAFNSMAPRLSYWNGCSSGGKQGLKEAQSFPDDYNGIIAGAPANYWTHLAGYIASIGQVVRKDAASEIPQSKYSLIHDAVLNQCDLQDKVKDDLLEDPRQCKFDPAVLQCKSSDAATCLTAAQVNSLKQVYAPARNPRTGQEIYPGLSVGGELGWAMLPQPFATSESHYKYVVHQDPNWDFHTFDLDKDIAKADAIDSEVGHFNAINPDLSAFKQHGGKLIQFHGWNDQEISPQNSINYYETVMKRFSNQSQVSDFYRLFMVPGMMHCQGGVGATDQFDRITALEEWVEKGKAPDRIVASHVSNGVTDRTRPLCPYPQIASWKGSGSTDDHNNFQCVDSKRK